MGYSIMIMNTTYIMNMTSMKYTASGIQDYFCELFLNSKYCSYNTSCFSDCKFICLFVYWICILLIVKIAGAPLYVEQLVQTYIDCLRHPLTVSWMGWSRVYVLCVQLPLKNIWNNIFTS